MIFYHERTVEVKVGCPQKVRTVMDVKGVLDRANLVFHCGGDPSVLMRRIEEEAPNDFFCFLSRRWVQGIIFSLDEMFELFQGLLQSSQDPQVAKFLRAKDDIYRILAQGIVHQTLTGL